MISCGQKEAGAMYFGVDYYPEQWEPGMLDEDLDRMVELGCNVIRIGEFAWHLMEPQEGKFDFSFFDRVIAAAGKRGLSVIFGTPTAARPRGWLMRTRTSSRSPRPARRGPTAGGMWPVTAVSPISSAAEP